MRCYRAWLRPLVILSIPIIFYCIPLFLGYAWNTMGPGVGPEHIYNRPEGYVGRYPNGYLSIDSLTPAVYNVPYDVSVRRYIIDRHLPLWNPGQALGIPFAAQGEGSPYFLFEILRSMLPYGYANYITFLNFFFAAIFMFCFLRNMGISENVSYLGSYSFILSGALSSQIIATNIVASMSIVPLLFWAITKAVRLQSSFWRSIMSLAVAMQIFAGHLQMFFVIFVTAISFSIYYIWLNRITFSNRIKEVVIIIIYFALGVGLSSLYLLPFWESLSIAHSTGHKNLGFYFLPKSHLLAFFCPLIWGQLHQGWFHINWFDLYAFTGLSIIVSVFGGFSVSSWNNNRHRSVFWFFVFAGLFWILRYIGFTPLNWIGWLPLFSQLSPKHSNGFTVFCLCTAASIAINHIQKWKLSRFIFILIVAFIAASSTFYWLISKAGYSEITIDFQYIIINVFLGVSTAAIFIYAIRLARKPEKSREQFLLFAIPAELIIYIPLGNTSTGFLLVRLILYVFLLLMGLFFTKMSYPISKHRSWVMGLMASVFVIAFVLLIHIPRFGLPNQYNLTVPPKYMVWLKDRLAIGERTFGIRPGYQTLANIHNIDTTGPFISEGFARFVNLVEGDDTSWFEGNGYFDVSLSEYNMVKYLHKKPFFDWLGVKNLILEKTIFDRRKKEFEEITNPDNGLEIVYQDNAATILESKTAQSRAYFTTNFKFYPAGVFTQKAIFTCFKDFPAFIGQTTLIEQPTCNSVSDELTITPDTLATQLPVEINKYEPNYVRLNVNSQSSGVIVLKDAFYPGWRAFINNKEVPILRANGMVRAVNIDHPGEHIVEFKYLPNSFIYGAILSTVSFIFIIGNLLIARLKRAFV